MKIYVSHASTYDFEKELYVPLRASGLVVQHDIVFPHDGENAGQDSREAIRASDLVIADVSYPSTGQGIELGWASYSNIPIVCIYKKGMVISSALKLITDTFLEYENAEDMIAQLTKRLIAAS